MISDKMAKILFDAAGVLRGELISNKLAELITNQSMTEKQIYEMTMLKLKKIIRYVSFHSPFYRERLQSIDVSQIQTFEDLHAIKPLTKEEVRNNVKLIASKQSLSRIRAAKTSGSTGIPLVFPKDSITRSYHYAAMYRGHSWYGLRIGDREARLWGVPVVPKDRLKMNITDFFLNRFRERDYNLTEQILDDFYYKINKFRPKYIMGYGKMLYEFGLYLKQGKRDLDHLKLKMVKYTTENIKEDEKDLIEEVFCCPVVSEYGAAETGIISFQCPKGSHHIMSDCIHLEYLDTDDQEFGFKEVLITDLNSFSFPIIRYKLGDLVVPSDGSCDCGLPFPILDKVQGRTSEIFTTGGNIKYHSIIFYYIMKGLASMHKDILQFRVVQKSPKTFCYQLAHKEKDEEVEKYVVNKTKQELGLDIEIETEYFETLPREPSGKLRDFVAFEPV